MTDTTVLYVHAEWDSEAEVWYVSDSDVPGLATEAATVPGLIEKLERMVPELMELNGHLSEQDVPFELLARYATTSKAQAAH